MMSLFTSSLWFTMSIMMMTMMTRRRRRRTMMITMTVKLTNNRPLYAQMTPMKIVIFSDWQYSFSRAMSTSSREGCGYTYR